MHTKNVIYTRRANNQLEVMTFEEQLQSMKDIFKNNAHPLPVEDNWTILGQLLTLTSQNELSCIITNDASQIPSLNTCNILELPLHSKNSF